MIRIATNTVQCVESRCFVFPPDQFAKILTYCSRQTHGVKPFCGVGKEGSARKRIKASGFLTTASDMYPEPH